MCIKYFVYCFMHSVVVKPMGHGSCIIGHGSVYMWVSGSWVTAYDPLPALHSCIAPEQFVCGIFVSGEQDSSKTGELSADMSQLSVSKSPTNTVGL